MNISKEVIEAARDAYESGVDEAIRRGIESTSHYFGLKYVLEAAAPMLMAEAWDEGVEAGGLYQFKVSRFLRGGPDPYPDDPTNPYTEEDQ